DKIQSIDTEAPEAILDRLHGPFFRVVIHDLVGAPVFEEITLFAEGLHTLLNFIEDDASDFTAEDVLVASVFRKFFSETNLGETRTIKWRRIEVTSALYPGRIDCRGSFGIGDVTEHVAQGGRSESQRTAQ